MDPDFILRLVSEYQYLILAPATILFGPVISIAAGIFIKLGTLELLPAVLALAGGELAADVLWYWLGYRFGEGFVGTYGKYVGISAPQVDRAKQLYQKHHDPIIFFSKIFGGFIGVSPAIFFTAGLSRISFKRYMFLNIVGQIFWTGGLIAAGYYLGNLFTNIDSAFKNLSIITFIIFVTIGLFGVSRFFRARANEKNGTPTT